MKYVIADNDEARKYVANLLDEKANGKACDDGFNYTFELPEWYDERKFKL